MFPQGINFRTTAGYVTDAADEDPEARVSGLGSNYPRTTVQGNVVGWEIDVTHVTRDRNAGNDRRLAGFNAQNGGSVVITYRIDLPLAGAYRIRWASGDADYASGSAIDLYDDATLLRALSTGTTSGANTFKDATNTERTAAAWPSDNQPIVATFASTILRLTSVPDGSSSMNYAHVRVEAANAVTSALRMGSSRRQRAGWSVSSPGGYF